MRIEATLQAHQRELLAIPVVTAVGIGHDDNKEMIIVFVRPDALATPDSLNRIPEQLDGYPVAVRPQLQIGRPESS